MKIHWPSFKRGMIDCLGSNFSLGFVIGGSYVMILWLALS